jgi:hypothetical protein
MRKLWLIAIVIGIIMSSVGLNGQSCGPLNVTPCQWCSAADGSTLTYCYQQMTGPPYFQNFQQNWDKVISGSCNNGITACSAGSCGLSPCTVQTVTFVGSCSGTRYTAVHNSCCEKNPD